MISVAKISRRTFVTAAIITISCGITYYADEKRNESRISSLEDQIDSLKSKVLLAQVDKRVSEQMEDIANEQSKISDLERDRAEYQTKIARTERSKAEEERGRALKAQNEALVSAERAKEAQEEAERQTDVAKRNEVIAQQASAKSDTLYHLSLANSLAQSSIVQFHNDNFDLARLLALTSLHYYMKYGGDPETQQNIYESLLNTSNTNHNYIKTQNNNILSIKGNIRKVHVLGNGDICGITDYGVVFLISNTTFTYDNIEKCNFRDFYAYNRDRCVALCSDGRLYEYNFDSAETDSIHKDFSYALKLQLPQGFWKRLIGINHGETLVAMSDNMVAWIDAKTMTVTHQAVTQSKTTCLGKQEQSLYVFCENGIQYYSSTPGQLQPYEFADFRNDKITAYIYNKVKGLHFLGSYSGKIYVYDNNGKKINELLGHDGPITDMHTWGEKLGSTSYDKTIRLWNIDNINAQVTSVAMSYNNWIYTFDVDKRRSILWLGSGNGEMPYFGYDVMKNASYTVKSLTREFTPEEWQYYVGKGDDQIYFMK